MNYAEILKEALKYNSLENLFREFFSIIDFYSCFTCISEKQFNEIAMILNKEKNGIHSIQEDDKGVAITANFGEYWYSDKEIERIQNNTYWIDTYDSDDFQILILSELNNFKMWLLPIFFEEFYSFCEGINNTAKKEREKISVDKKEICNILATKIVKNLDGITTILKEFENADDDKTINFLTELFNAYLS